MRTRPNDHLGRPPRTTTLDGHLRDPTTSRRRTTKPALPLPCGSSNSGTSPRQLWLMGTVPSDYFTVKSGRCCTHHVDPLRMSGQTLPADPRELSFDETQAMLYITMPSKGACRYTHSPRSRSCRMVEFGSRILLSGSRTKQTLDTTDSAHSSEYRPATYPTGGGSDTSSERLPLSLSSFGRCLDTILTA